MGSPENFVALGTHLKKRIKICHIQSDTENHHQSQELWSSVSMCWNMGSSGNFVALGTHLKKRIKICHIQSDTENYHQSQELWSSVSMCWSMGSSGNFVALLTHLKITYHTCYVLRISRITRINWLYSLSVSLSAGQLFGSSSIIHLRQGCHYN